MKLFADGVLSQQNILFGRSFFRGGGGECFSVQKRVKVLPEGTRSDFLARPVQFQGLSFQCGVTWTKNHETHLYMSVRCATRDGQKPGVVQGPS